jgi:N-acetylmuramoyl-L-alanine amidase
VTRRILGSILALLLFVGCAVATVPTTSTSTTTTIPVTTTTVPTTTTTVPTTTTTLNPGPVLGLITPTGVPVGVILQEGGRYLVNTPCLGMAWVGGGEPLYRTSVVLDPGHGGTRDIGAQGANGLPEKVVNLDLAFEIQRVLESRGISTVLTRTRDYATTIPARTRLADRLRADVLVSIHHNAPAPEPSPTPGTEVFYQSASEKSRRLAGLLFEYTYNALLQFDVAWTATPETGAFTVLNDRGTDTYGMLRLPRTPAALLEVGYINNPPEAELFATDEYLAVVGEAIADAIEAYLVTDEPGSGWTEGRVFTAQPGLSGAQCIESELE